MNNMKLTIGYLYGDVMNIYGDIGNIIALQHRSTLRSIETQVRLITIGTAYKSKDADILFFGGGQDKSQIIVANDLDNEKASVIKSEVERGVPLLSICGGYQLLGEYYQPLNARKINGIGLFPAYTQAGDKRMIGNIVIDSDFGKLVGFENHSGKTFLNDGATALGTVVKGFGNNGVDPTEGCRYNNAIGCYMHGSLLPKNPILTDWLISTALSVKYNKNVKLAEIDNELEERARKQILKIS